MPENEFDKQVKKMMDGLKLCPSEAVWPGVERRIREKNRRRRAFILLPLLAGLMLLGYLGIQYLNSKQDDKKSGVNSIDLTKKQNDNKVLIPLRSTNADKKNQGEIKDSLQKQEKTIKEISSPERIRNVSVFDKSPNKKHLDFSKRKAAEIFLPPVLKDENKRQPIPSYQNKSEKNENPSTIVSNQKNENRIVSNPDSFNIAVNNDTNVLKEGTILPDSSQVKEVTLMNPITDSAVSNKQQKDKKLTWGFHLSTGVSGTRRKFLQLSQNNVLEASSSPNFTPGGATYSRTVQNPGKSGIAYKAGALIEKSFSKRRSFDVGIQYSYYSDQIKVGQRTDSVIRIAGYSSADLLVSGFYPNASTNNYTNRYHFIELPINFHHQLFNGKNNSLSWDFGMSIGQLLSTNSLVFDTTNQGVYYADKKFIRKISANLSTGFSMTFNKHKSLQWIIGPQIQLGLVNLYKGYSDKKAYPFFAGVDLRLMLPKK